jgi:hypothetical protein
LKNIDQLTQETARLSEGMEEQTKRISMEVIRLKNALGRSRKEV